jgi:ABC-2 type transport system permease protein
MTASQLQVRGRPVPVRLALLRDVLASEWTKLRSLRSNRWTLGVAVVVTLILTGVVAESFAAAPDAGQHAPIDRIAGSFLAYAEYTVLPVTVLSVLVFTSEYGSGLIRTTLSAVPQRGTVLAAKAAVAGAAALVTGEVLAFACFFLTQGIVSGRHGGVSLAHPGALRAVLAAGFALAVCAVAGVGIGAAFRHTAGAIAAAVTVVYLLAAACLALPAPWNIRLGRFTLPFAAYAEVAAHPPAGLLSPALSLLVLIAWPAVILLAATVVLTRKDI